MGGERDGHYHHQPAQAAAPASSRVGLRAAGGVGEIVEVQGGHIVRSTGRKDRHSKVCTAKGPRDRRVRLSAHTAIQFYDVQDRLGYDRPSKAVDWLIMKAKAAIDELAELPAWHPTAIPASAANKPDDSDEPDPQEDNPGKKLATGDDDPTSIHSSFEHRYLGPPGPGMDSDAVIADTIKSFFPMVAATTAPSIPFRSYTPEFLSRTTSGQAQDLRLSLQSFPEPMLHHSEPPLFSTAAMSFDGGASSSWSEHHHDMARYWPGTSAGGPGYMFGSGLPPVMTAPAYQGQAHLFPQRGPLQSSNSPQVRAWPDSTAIPDHQSPAVGSVLDFASGGFSGFRVPARFRGEEDHDPVGGHKPPAGSSAPRH